MQGGREMPGGLINESKYTWKNVIIRRVPVFPEQGGHLYFLFWAKNAKNTILQLSSHCTKIIFEEHFPMFF